MPFVVESKPRLARRWRASGVLALAFAAVLLVAAGLIVLAVWVVAVALLYGAARQVRQARTQHSMAGVTWRAAR